MTNKLLLIFSADFHNLPISLQEEVYQEFCHMVYGMVQCITGDHSASEDFIQEAFLRAVRKSSQLQKLEGLEGWLKTLTRNVALNQLRKIKKNRGELNPKVPWNYREAASSA